METKKRHTPKKNRLIYALLEVVLIIIGTLIVIFIIKFILNISYPDSTLFISGIDTIILSSIVAALFAYFLIYDIPKTQLTTESLAEEKIYLKNQLEEMKTKLDKVNGLMVHETAERHLMEKALNEKESLFQAIIQKAPTGIAFLDKEYAIIECNPLFQNMLGYDREELIGVRFNQALHPDDAVAIKKQLKGLVEGESDIYRGEHRYIHKELSEVWGVLSASVVRNTYEEPQLIIAIIEDVTKRRQSEENILKYQQQLKSLTFGLSLTEEQDRRRLATNLHDHIGQVLSWTRIKISELEESLLHTASESIIKEISDLIDQVIQYTRYLMFEISPPILYDLGFEETIEWLAEHFTREHGLQIQVTRDHQPKPLTNEMSILLFQAVRELLYNIVKHAQATVVKTSIQRACNDLQVIVEDNGVGFDPRIIDRQSNQTKGLGLFSIYERLEYFGGSLEIESEPGHGTRATLLMPMVQAEKITWAEFQKKYLQNCRV